MANCKPESRTPLRNADLSKPSESWQRLAAKQAEIDKALDSVYDLPIEEFRKIPYKPAPLPADIPIPDRDLVIREQQLKARDGVVIKIRIYEPLNRDRGHLLFFNIHGGGWTVGTPETEEAQNRLVAVKNGAVVCSVDYRRAPEHPFPYALHDSIDALTWCQNHSTELGIDPRRVVIGGGSAGANIAAVVAQIYRNDRRPGIVGQVLNIPVVCHPIHHPTDKYELVSYQKNADGPIVGAKRMNKFWSNYLPAGQADPRANPLLAVSLKNLPPALVQVAGMDPLRDEGLAYAEALRHDGVPVDVKVYPGVPHAFYVYPDLQESIDYVQTTVDWVGKFTL